jgi:hypothetical protein
MDELIRYESVISAGRASAAKALSPINNLPYALLAHPKHIPECLQRRASFPRLNDCHIAGDAPSNLLSQFQEY